MIILCNPRKPPENICHMGSKGSTIGMHLVENHVFQVLEEALRLLVSEQQRHLFRCCQQDIRRSQLLALPLGLRRISGAVLDADRQAHLRDGLHQVAFYIDG